MISPRILEQVLADQKEELAAKKHRQYVSRKEETAIDLDSSLAQVVIGVRRSGKSTLCYTALQRGGVHYAYINFDDERLYNLQAEDLNTLLEVSYKVYGEFTHLFLDEVQNIPEWYLFVNRLLRREIRLVITGSNAKLLSGELATHLTGRHHTITLYPFSFAEYCAYHKVDTISVSTQSIGLLRRAFDKYLETGGFPEMQGSNRSRDYVINLVNSILQRDIEQRYAIRYKASFEQLAHHVMNLVPTLLNDDWQEWLKLGSVNTLKNYIGYLQQAFLLIGLHKYSPKSRVRLAGMKLYPVDVALMNRRQDAFSGENLGWRLESLVYIELLRRAQSVGQDVYYYADRSGECDFIVCENNKAVQAVQVSYDISTPATRKREINGLLLAARKTGCDNLLLLTDHQYEDIEVQGKKIAIRPVYQFVLD